MLFLKCNVTDIAIAWAADDSDVAEEGVFTPSCVDLGRIDSGTPPALPAARQHLR